MFKDFRWQQTVLNGIFTIAIVIICIIITDMLNVSRSQDRALKEMKEEIEKFEQTTRITHD